MIRKKAWLYRQLLTKSKKYFQHLPAKHFVLVNENYLTDVLRSVRTVDKVSVMVSSHDNIPCIPGCKNCF